MLTVAPVLAIASRAVSNTGSPKMLLAAAPRRDPAHQLGAVGEALLRVKGALFAGKTLANDLGILVDQNAHDPELPPCCTAFTAASVRSLAGVMARPLLGQHFPRQGRIGALQPHDDRNAYAHLFDGRDDALGDHVAADDAAEDIDQNRADSWDSTGSA